MGLGGDLPTDGVMGIGAEEPELWLWRGPQQSSRRPIGKGRLANTLWPDQQPSMMQTPT